MVESRNEAATSAPLRSAQRAGHKKRYVFFLHTLALPKQVTNHSTLHFEERQRERQREGRNGEEGNSDLFNCGVSRAFVCCFGFCCRGQEDKGNQSHESPSYVYSF